MLAWFRRLLLCRHVPIAVNVPLGEGVTLRYLQCYVCEKKLSHGVEFGGFFKERACHE